MTILCHRSPDGDAIGSGYALGHGLRRLGKRVRMRCADPCSPDLAAFVEDPGTPGDWQERYIVAVDTADQKLLGSLEAEYDGRVDLVIDHHPSNTGYGKNTCLDATAAATAELMTGLLAALGVPLDHQLATCLYIGIATDTGCFRYANTTARTLRTAAALLEAGVDTEEINRVFFETKKPGRVALECNVLQNLRYFCDSRCAVMTIPLELLDRFRVDENELDGLSALPRQIEGVQIGITIREQQGYCRVSVRTTKEADASALCHLFGGGGHLRAGGCTIQGTPAQAAELLTEAAQELLARGAFR